LRVEQLLERELVRSLSDGLGMFGRAEEFVRERILRRQLHILRERRDVLERLELRGVPEGLLLHREWQPDVLQHGRGRIRHGFDVVYFQLGL
jgi:hypothetical protein